MCTACRLRVLNTLFSLLAAVKQWTYFFYKRCSIKGVNFTRLYKICSRFGVYLTTEYLSYSTGCPWCCLLSLFKLIITSRKSYGYVQFTIVVARSFFWALLIITCIKQKWANKQQKGCLFFIVSIIIMEFSKDMLVKSFVQKAWRCL